MTNKTTTYTDMDKTIYSVLKNADRPLALCEISKIAGVNIKAGHIISATRKGIAAKADELVIVTKPTKKKVGTYFATGLTIEEFTARRPKNRVTAKEVALLDALNALDNTPRTISQINEDAGLDGDTMFKSGTFTSLVNKGLVAKGEDVEFAVEVPTKVNAYILGSTVIEDAEAK